MTLRGFFTVVHKAHASDCLAEALRQSHGLINGCNCPGTTEQIPAEQALRQIHKAIGKPVVEAELKAEARKHSADIN